MQYVGIIGFLCLLAAFILLFYRLHRKEQDLLGQAGFVPADTSDGLISSAAVRFTGREPADSYVYEPLCREGRCPVHLFRHVPYSDEPPITSLVIESRTQFERTVVVHKVYGSHLLFRVFKKMFIKTGDLGIEGENMAELGSFNDANFERYGLFAMAEPGFDANDADFMKMAEALRGLDRKSVVALGLSGRHIVGWSAETAQVLKLWDKLRVISAV